MKQATLNWLHGAEYDLQTAESLFKSRRYIYVIFMCHLAVEKVLKAILTEISSDAPPRTHNLYRLLELGRLEVPEVHNDIVAKLNTMSITTRYPEDLEAFSAEITRKLVREYFTKTKDLLQWLRHDPRLQP
jgi:HEPN domain-containing protein